APTEAARPAAPPVTDAAWQARGADPILLYRPSLRARADREIPAGRASNIPALLKVIEGLNPIAAAHKGSTQAGSPRLGEPATVYAPTDDELLLSLAGDRIWRSLQLMPPGTLDGVRQQNPDWKMEPVEYAHIEIVRVNAAGSGPHVFALAPAPRNLSFG